MFWSTFIFLAHCWQLPLLRHFTKTGNICCPCNSWYFVRHLPIESEASFDHNPKYLSVCLRATASVIIVNTCSDDQYSPCSNLNPKLIAVIKTYHLCILFCVSSYINTVFCDIHIYYSPSLVRSLVFFLCDFSINAIRELRVRARALICIVPLK
jgi:hypothetical protein